MTSLDHWQQHAKNWKYFGSPLRPVKEDIQWYERQLSTAFQTTGKALLLGVTTEIFQMKRPSGMGLLAIDQSIPMINHLKQNIPEQHGTIALAGNWLQLPMPDKSVDTVLGDGVPVFFSFPDGFLELVKEIHRVLVPEGKLLIRVFLRPDTQEAVDDIHCDLRDGRIGSFHVYKWRLAMALQTSLKEGVCLIDIWKTFHEYFPDPGELSKLTGWALEEILTINAYKDSHAIYRYPTLRELQEAVDGYFVIFKEYFPGYELGERCPTIGLKRIMPK